MRRRSNQIEEIVKHNLEDKNLKTPVWVKKYQRMICQAVTDFQPPSFFKPKIESLRKMKNKKFKPLALDFQTPSWKKDQNNTDLDQCWTNLVKEDKNQ